MIDNLARMNHFSEAEQVNQANTQYAQLKTHYDAKYSVGWYFMNAQPRSCFTSALLSEINAFQEKVKSEMLSGQKKYDYLVLASDVDDVFNLGGDLAVFFEMIKKKDRAGLLAYAIKCIDVLHHNITHLDCELTTIALVQGDALGGGFEAALSSNILIAERGTKLGLPEVLFNLFPGMGAYSLLSRKVSGEKRKRLFSVGSYILLRSFMNLALWMF